MEELMELFRQYAVIAEEQKAWGLHMRLWPNNSGAVFCYDFKYKEETVLTEWVSTEEALAAMHALMNDLNNPKHIKPTTKFADWKPNIRAIDFNLPRNEEYMRQQAVEAAAAYVRNFPPKARKLGE